MGMGEGLARCQPVAEGGRRREAGAQHLPVYTGYRRDHRHTQVPLSDYSIFPGPLRACIDN